MADTKLISKIIDDFAPEELDEFGNKYLEATRMGRPSGLGAEAYKTTVLQQFFPDLKIPQAQLKRSAKAWAGRSMLDALGGAR